MVNKNGAISHPRLNEGNLHAQVLKISQVPIETEICQVGLIVEYSRMQVSFVESWVRNHAI
jgi:hypothetical protein